MLKFIAVVLLLIAIILPCVAQDAGQPAPAAPPAPRQMVGAGEHKITAIFIRARGYESSQDKDKKAPVTIKVGASVPLQVSAAWMIPYVGVVTDKTKFTLSHPSLAAINAEGVLKAKRPGTVVVKAELRVADKGNRHEVLGPNESAGDSPVLRFTDRIAFKIVE